LLATRGVPGTHDLTLLNSTVDDLLSKEPPYVIPKFLKAIDDRALKDQWPVVTHDVKIIILEGWCVGCPSQSESQLIKPVNALEENEDIDALWRTFINNQLKTYEQSIFNKIDYLVMLKAPGFHIVKQWRQEQETKLKATLNNDIANTGVMSAEEIERFIAHYQRITEHGFLEIPKIADDVFVLNEQRQVTSVSTRSK
jgi:D-glycerate 3-kinase